MTRHNASRFYITTHLIFILCLGWWTCACEENHEQLEYTDRGPAKIINGIETNYETWQGVIGLMFSSGYMSHICTGTLIDTEVVLTAGHCVYMPEEGIDLINENTNDLEIVGGSNMDIHYTWASRIIKHDKWNGNIYDPLAVDLAIIYLEEPVLGVETYGLSHSPLQVGQNGIIVGYGNNTNSGGDTVHREGTTKVIELKGEKVFELGYPTGTCRGDSGGPFFASQDDKWVVAGVTSYGVGTECLAHMGNWDVNVYTYREWINSIVEELTGHEIIPHSSTTDDPNPADTDTDNGQNVFGMNNTNPVDCMLAPSTSAPGPGLFPVIQYIFL